MGLTAENFPISIYYHYILGQALFLCIFVSKNFCPRGKCLTLSPMLRQRLRDVMNIQGNEQNFVGAVTSQGVIFQSLVWKKNGAFGKAPSFPQNTT